MVVADAEYVDIADAEQVIMHWAAEHPEPVYPTWSEWYKKNFPGAYHDGKRICPATFDCKKNCDGKDDCDKCRDRPIPANIAEKFGIKPIAEKEQETVHNGCFRCKHILKSLLDDPCAKCRGWTKVVSGSEHGKLWEEG